MGALGISKELFANAAYMYAVKSPQLLLVHVRMRVRVRVRVLFLVAFSKPPVLHPVRIDDEHAPYFSSRKATSCYPAPVPSTSKSKGEAEFVPVLLQCWCRHLIILFTRRIV